ncbi:MAG TPA: hypothetical protein VFW78_01630 [Bacteroidia bacterium]|nr:hypothetical protein [Bacteroidia bacterium]
MYRILLTGLVSMTLMGTIAKAQESLDRYTASNGLVVSDQDSITIGVGSLPDGSYQYIYMSSLISPLSTSNIDYCRTNFKLQAGQEGTTVAVRKIKRANGKVYAFVPLGGSTSFIIEIEEAISGCELAFCRPAGYLNQQQFEKLILMRDAYKSGNLSEERFYELRNEFLETADPEPEHLE